MVRSLNRVRMPVDNILIGATFALVVIGMCMVFDCSYIKTVDSPHPDTFFFVKKQAFGAIVGLIAMAIMSRIGYWQLRKIALPLMITSLALLLAVWVPHIGVNKNHALRWIALGSLQFQPSELAKVALILYVCAVLSRADCKIRSFAEGLGPALTVSALTLILIEREPDLGTAAVLFLAVFTLLFLAGTRKRVLLLILIASVSAVLLLGFGFSHRHGRITAFLHPERDRQGVSYQIYHSVLAVGSGELTGVGLGQGHEKYYLPQGDTDFIFATVAEELGFAQTVPILLLLLLVGARGFVIARKTKDRFGALIAAGIAALISWQALINIAVATASIPATGVPLPFISYGSTSLVMLMAGVGILLNIAQHPMRPLQTGSYAATATLS